MPHEIKRGELIILKVWVDYMPKWNDAVLLYFGNYVGSISMALTCMPPIYKETVILDNKQWGILLSPMFISADDLKKPGLSRDIVECSDISIGSSKTDGKCIDFVQEVITDPEIIGILQTKLGELKRSENEKEKI